MTSDNMFFYFYGHYLYHCVFLVNGLSAITANEVKHVFPILKIYALFISRHWFFSLISANTLLLIYYWWIQIWLFLLIIPNILAIFNSYILPLLSIKTSTARTRQHFGFCSVVKLGILRHTTAMENRWNFFWLKYIFEQPSSYIIFTVFVIFIIGYVFKVFVKLSDVLI